MSPRLPIELDQMIIKHAQDGLSVLEGHSARVKLRLVCQAWRDSIDPGRELIVVGNDNVNKAAARLANKRASGDRRFRVKSIYIKLQSPSSKAKAESVARLLSLVVNVEHVQLVTKYASMKGAASERSSLADVVVSALTRLAKVEHFAFGEDRTVRYYPILFTTDLAR